MKKLVQTVEVNDGENYVESWKNSILIIVFVEVDLSALTLTSKDFRNRVEGWLYSRAGVSNVMPCGILPDHAPYLDHHVTTLKDKVGIKHKEGKNAGTGFRVNFLNL